MIGKIWSGPREIDIPGPFLIILTRVSKTNGKNMLDCFINIYVRTEFSDWIYRECCKSV